MNPEHEHQHEPTEAEQFKARLQTLVDNLQRVGDSLALREMYAEAGVVHAGKQTVRQLYARMVEAEAVMAQQAPPVARGQPQTTPGPDVADLVPRK